MKNELNNVSSFEYKLQVFFLFHALIDNWVQFLFTYQLGAPMELPSFYGQDHERYDDRFLS